MHAQALDDIERRLAALGGNERVLDRDGRGLVVIGFQPTHDGEAARCSSAKRASVAWA